MKLWTRLSDLHSHFLVPTAALALATAAGAQTTYWVDDDGPGDPFPGVSIPGNPTFSDPAEDGSTAHPFDDVQKAIAAASNGDEVVVLPSNVAGAYFLVSPIDLMGKNVTLRSQAGPAQTVIDGTTIPGSPGLSADQGEGPGMVIEGFLFQTFDRGSAVGANGGAIEILNSSPTVRDCWFTGNHAYVGAAVYTSNSASRFENCLFEGNTSVHQGGAVYTNAGTPVFADCTFRDNTADFGGAFLSRTNGATLVQVVRCVFVENRSLIGYAGALAKFDGGSIEIRRSRFLSNEAALEGGGVHLSGGGTIRDCTFNSNVAGTYGGGVSTISSGLHTITGSTFYGNSGGGLAEGAGIVFTDATNCIFWNNTPYEIGANVAVSYCDVLGGYDGVENLNADPVFVDADGPDNVQGNLDDDLSLFPGSPCIDAGNTAVLPDGYPKDLLGRSRAVDAVNVTDTGIALVGHTTDMGAFELTEPCPIGRVRIR